MGTNLLVPSTNGIFAALLESHRAQDQFASHLHSQRVMSCYFYLLASLAVVFVTNVKSIYALR